MRVLEARLHLVEEAGPVYVTIGYFVWDDDGLVGKLPRVQTPGSDPEKDSGTVRATLGHLARMTAPNSFDGLRSLQNRYWSFVEVEAVPSETFS